MLDTLERQMSTPTRPSAEPLGEASFYAFQIGGYEKAREYATEGVSRAKKRSDYAARYAGQTIYYAHWTLGRLALRDGDAETARNECADFWPHADLKAWGAAVQAGESPTFFPTMMR